MTSARNRVFADDSNHESFALSHTYQQWRRPEGQANFTPSNLSSNYIQDPFKPKVQGSYFNNFIEPESSKQQKSSTISETQKYQPPTIQSRSPVSSVTQIEKSETSGNQFNKKSNMEANKMAK